MGQRQWRSRLFVARHVTRAWQHWFNLTILRAPIRRGKKKNSAGAQYFTSPYFQWR